MRNYVIRALFLLVGIVTPLLLFSACTEKQRARNFGGNMTVPLECGQKLFDITWKDDSLWYATRPMRPGETAETYKFVEDSSFGIFEGSVTLVECN